MSCAARLEPPGHADETCAAALSKLSLPSRPSKYSARCWWTGDRNAVPVPARAKLHELPFTGTRVESSFRLEADAIGMSMMKRNLMLTLFIGAATLTSAAHGQAVDTSEWACEYCPFEEGYRADFEVGAMNVSDDSAYFGDATGLD